MLLTRSEPAMSGESFHSTFAQISATLLAIILAFYGILGVNLAQQAQMYNSNVNQNLLNVENAIWELSYITKPPVTSWSNWTIPRERENNAYMIVRRENWNNSVTEVLNPLVEDISNNFSKAEQMDNEVRDWLTQTNRSRFLTNYLFVLWSLDDLVDGIYEEFPPPPAQYDYWHVVRFIDITFPENETVFRSWAARFGLYSSGISDIRQRISRELNGISEAYLDDARMESQTVDMLISLNRTDERTLLNFQEMIRYDGEMSSHYTSIFDAISVIYSQVKSTVTNMDMYHRIYDLAFSDIQWPVIVTSISGVAMPMAILGTSGYIFKHRNIWSRKQRFGYCLIVAISIVVFVAGLSWTIDVLWRQIRQLYLT